MIKVIVDDGITKKEIWLMIDPCDAPHLGDWVTINGFRGVVNMREWRFGQTKPISQSRLSETSEKEFTITVGRKGHKW